ncbi:hypothetical protein L209DRAFT_598748 [Thermothelomyces heterothallicus CBS 203.75]
MTMCALQWEKQRGVEKQEKKKKPRNEGKRTRRRYKKWGEGKKKGNLPNDVMRLFVSLASGRSPSGREETAGEAAVGSRMTRDGRRRRSEIGRRRTMCNDSPQDDGSRNGFFAVSVSCAVSHSFDWRGVTALCRYDKSSRVERVEEGRMWGRAGA